MTEQEAKQIIQHEDLRRINWYEPNNLHENEVGLAKIQSGYIIYITDERASVITGSEFKFQNSSDAYRALIKKARYLQKLFG